MNTQPTTDPWRRVTGLRQAELLTMTLKGALKFLLYRSYRAGRPELLAGSTWSRLRPAPKSAVYDVVISLMLDGFCQIAGSGVNPDTGPLVVLLNRLIAAFDDEYERRLQIDGDLRFEEILAAPGPSIHLKALSNFLAPYPQRHEIREFLEHFASENYENYIALTKGEAYDESLKEQLQGIGLDSGGFLLCTAQVVSVFNGHTPRQTLLAQFSCLGVVGKLADDMVDAWWDYRDRSTNVLLGIARQYAGEREKIASEVSAGRTRAGYRWWRSRCPATFSEFTDILAEYRSTITAQGLIDAGDLMLIPAVYGGPQTRPPAWKRHKEPER